MRKYHIIIPARWSSSRFPGKAVTPINGKPLIQYVYEHALECYDVADVIIATDSEKIFKVARDFGADVQMTNTHTTGTGRIAQLVVDRRMNKDDVIVNLQCDEPTMPHSNIRQVVKNLYIHMNFDAATLCEPITSQDDFENPNIIKAVWDADGRAMYFSRSPIPYNSKNGYRHIGIYAYWVRTLCWYHSLAACLVEQAEILEQLRIMWYGGRIHVAKALSSVGPSVDIPTDVEKVEKYLNNEEV